MSQSMPNMIQKGSGTHTIHAKLLIHQKHKIKPPQNSDGGLKDQFCLKSGLKSVLGFSVLAGKKIRCYGNEMGDGIQ